MSKILIKLTPLEPYFFGSDRAFTYGDQSIQKSGKYFIRSLDAPSQAALLGTLRHLLKKDPGFRISPDDERLIGPGTFHLQKSGQSFGIIKGLSPLYLVGENNRFYVKIPFDHRVKSGVGENERVNSVYSPFEVYRPFDTGEGVKQLPLDYKAKHRIADGYMSVEDGSILDNAITGVIRTGIDKHRKNKAYFKKEYKILAPGLSFAFFADMEDGCPAIGKEIIFMGQGKSAFRAEADAGVDEPSVAGLIGQGFAYAASDIYPGNRAPEIYRLCSFASVKVKDYRGFSTNTRAADHYARFSKDAASLKLFEAGSVFRVDGENNRAEFSEKISDSHAAQAGYNQIVWGNKK